MPTSFDQMDLNGDGVVTRSEFEAAARVANLSTAGRAVPSPSRGGAGYEGVIGELDAFVKTAGMYTHRR